MPARILVIEDNVINLELIVYLLKAVGHDTTFTPDGREGVEMALSAIPDMILCDIQLPGFSGFEVVKLLKAEAATRKVPLIAVTALAMVGDRSRIIEAGFDGYISKPIEPQKLLDEIDQFFQPPLRSLRRSAHQGVAAPPS